MSKKVLIAGVGDIGCELAKLLVREKGLEIYLADINEQWTKTFET